MRESLTDTCTLQVKTGTARDGTMSADTHKILTILCILWAVVRGILLACLDKLWLCSPELTSLFDCCGSPLTT